MYFYIIVGAERRSLTELLIHEACHHTHKGVKIAVY